MNKWVRRLLFALQFMTRYPIHLQLDVQSDDFPRMSVFFPVVGLCTGLFAAVFAAAGLLLGKSALLAGILGALGGVLITGAFHLDGAGDMFDALGSSRDRERMLEIMKDSRMGTMGVTAIVFDLLLRCGLISILAGYYGWRGALLVAAGSVAGRLTLGTGGYLGKSARKNGMGKPFIDDMNGKDFLKQLPVAFIIEFVLLWGVFCGSGGALQGYQAALMGAAVLCCAAPLAAVVIVKKVSRALGGITGDTLGLLNECGEIFALLLMVILSSCLPGGLLYA
jgi:adenosylcobinamide-GDP ribazoletransferase